MLLSVLKALSPRAFHKPSRNRVKARASRQRSRSRFARTATRFSTRNGARALMVLFSACALRNVPYKSVARSLNQSFNSSPSERADPTHGVFIPRARVPRRPQTWKHDG